MSPSQLSTSQQRDFLERLEPGVHIAELFGCLPETNYFVKDAHGRFVLVDPGFVAMVSRSRADEVLGRTDFDFFPKDVAEKYVSDDRRVMMSGEPLRDLIETVPDEDLVFQWWIVNKVPLRDRQGRIVGVAGVTSKLSEQNAPTWHHEALGRVLRVIGRDYRNRLNIAELARQAGISVRSLERAFVRTFQTTPLRYLNRVRLQAARHALVHSHKPIATIAAETGFYDQSHLTAQFTRAYGQSPSRYRRAQHGAVATERPNARGKVRRETPIAGQAPKGTSRPRPPSDADHSESLTTRKSVASERRPTAQPHPQR